MKLFFEPENAYFGDCMPFYHDGVFYLYHQRDTRDPAPFEPFDWSLSTTTDFVHYEDRGTAIPKEGEDDPEQYIFAGSVFAGEGRFHAVYTAYNRNYAAQGKDSQVLMSAVSDDLLHWEKNGKFVLPAPEGYDGTEWRDPFVLWDEESGRYIMILGTRKLEGRKIRTGRTVWFTSSDLTAWEFQGDFWAPDLFYMHEMPDLFKMGDWWYLLTTEYSERKKTVYRMSRSLNGPWIAPKDDAFDGRSYYAARSCSDGEHRYLFGWAATKTGAEDTAIWDWAGTYVCHEVYQREDGSLAVKLPDSMLAAFEFAEEKLEASVELDSTERIQTCPFYEADSDCFMAEMEIQFTEDARKFGLRLFEDEETGDSYKFEVNLAEHRLYFDRTPNMEWPRYMDKGLERPLELVPGKKYNVRLIVDDSIAIMYIDGTALTARMHDKAGKSFCLFAADGGSVRISSIKVAKRS